MGAAKKEVVVTVRITEDGMTKIDRLRGGWSRSAWLRAAMAHAVNDKLAGPAAF